MDIKQKQVVLVRLPVKEMPLKPWVAASNIGLNGEPEVSDVEHFGSYIEVDSFDSKDHATAFAFTHGLDVVKRQADGSFVRE